MNYFIWTSLILVAAGCSRQEKSLPFESTPELVRLFGSEENVQTVQHAYTSSHLSLVTSPAPYPAGPAMYSDGRVAKLSDILGRSDSYAWDKSIDGEFVPNIKVEFVGEAHFKSVNAGGSPRAVVVFLDRKREVIEVQSVGVTNQRASYSPAADRLESYFSSVGISPLQK